MSDLYWDEAEILECQNHCDWRGTIAELDNPEEDVYRCPKCGASTDMILAAQSSAMAEDDAEVA